jgi:hypothetical protein
MAAVAFVVQCPPNYQFIEIPGDICLIHARGNMYIPLRFVLVAQYPVTSMIALEISPEPDWYTFIWGGRQHPCGVSRSEIRYQAEPRYRGIGFSFQPAIVASRLDLINCDIAPSAKIRI